tara:strand:- start:68 stop:556 length:489 start_codon:yes stop_codon:yes gene_type:complete
MIGILVFGLVALSAVCLWLLIEQRKSWRFLVWFIPVLLILSTSTYYTYTSILGYPKVAVPERGLYLKHHIAEPHWIYLWVLGKDNIPRSYQIVYSREKHNALEGVKAKSDEGKFMVIKNTEGRDSLSEGEMVENERRGFSIGGDLGFYEWDYEASLTPKDPQ